MCNCMCTMIESVSHLFNSNGGTQKSEPSGEGEGGGFFFTSCQYPRSSAELKITATFPKSTPQSLSVTNIALAEAFMLCCGY